jgi:DNA repair protein RadC
MTASKMPLSEMPRERMMRDGIDALSLQELVAILLGTGTQGKPVHMLSQEIVHHFGGLEGLLDASLEELMQVKGVGRAKAILLKAAFGVAARAQRKKHTPYQKLTTAREMYELAHLYIGDLKKEALFIALRDVRQRLIHTEVVHLGTLANVQVHPREIFAPAVRHGAYTIVIAHNHPSGDPTPSEADYHLTKWLLESAKIMDIAIVDHIIVGKERYVSMKNTSLFT